MYFFLLTLYVNKKCSGNKFGTTFLKMPKIVCTFCNKATFIMQNSFPNSLLNKRDFLKIINLYSVILPLLLLDFLLMTPYSQFTIQFCLTIWIPLVTNSHFWSGNVVPMLSMPHWLCIKKWPRYLYIFNIQVHIGKKV